MRERLRWLLVVYDWLARVHFALYTLGGLAGLGALMSWLLSAYLPALLFGSMAAVALILGSVGWIRSRHVDRDTAWWKEHARTNLGLAEFAVETAEKFKKVAEAELSSRPRRRAKPRSRGRSKRD
jgi:hypothetical protein